MVRYFTEKVDVGRLHFKSLFRDPKGTNIGETMRILSLLHSLINEDMNRALEAYITCEEVLNVMSSFKKRKIPCPHGLSMEFYLSFFISVKRTCLKWFRG
jgi:hypothetical protein